MRDVAAKAEALMLAEDPFDPSKRATSPFT